MEITVKLHGDISRFGDKFTVDVKNVGQAINAIIQQVQGFRQALQKGQYLVRLGTKYCTEDTILPVFSDENMDNATLHIIPVIKGAKSGVFAVIAGVVIIIASIVSFQYYGVGAGVALAMGAVGAGLAFSGMASMMTKTPDIPKTNESEKKSSTAFSNLANLVAQGRPVPLAYGRIMVGSLEISKGVETFTVDRYIPDTKNVKGLRGLHRKKKG